MRDGGFEMGIKNPSAKDPTGAKEEYYSWYRIMNGQIDLMDGIAGAVENPEGSVGKNE